MERINITIEKETLMNMDALANEYGMNRSAFITFMEEVFEELEIMQKLNEKAKKSYSEKFGHYPEYDRMGKSYLLKASREIEIN